MLRAWFNRCRRAWVRVLLHRMVFGERAPAGGQGLPHTRISPSTVLDHPERLVLADHVYIGPFNFLEASGGLRIDEGVQITSHCSIVTHSSHRALRLMGRAYADARLRVDRRAPQDLSPGWIEGEVHIGAYTFVGPHSVIEAGSRIGRGSLVCAGSVVRGQFPDFAVLRGNPAQWVGDTREGDAGLLLQHPELKPLYEAWASAAAATSQQAPQQDQSPRGARRGG